MDSGMWYSVFQQEAHTVLSFPIYVIFKLLLVTISCIFISPGFTKSCSPAIIIFICNAGTSLKRNSGTQLFSYTFDTGKAGCTLYPFPLSVS